MKQLLFVYNADSGLFNTLTDFAHKIMSPSTYPCCLCSLTYGSITMKKEWKLFISQLPVETVFLHRNEWKTQYGLSADLPAVFIKENGLQQLLSKEQIVNCTTLQQLKDLIIANLLLHDKRHYSHL